jgi:NarL family two-component system response regulator YdfI
LLKDTTSDTLFQTIRSAARGETLLQSEIMTRLLSQASSSASLPLAVSPPGTIALTEREREILAEVAQGERSKEIALRLGITTHTVATHLTNIYAKLGVDSRTSAVVVAIERGLLPRHKHTQ